MKCLINQKTDMKLVLMSATINIELFSNYFAKENVSVIQVSLNNLQKLSIFVIRVVTI